MLSKLSFESQVNAVGALVFALIGGYVVSELVRTRDTPVCQTRYPAPTQMSLLRANGIPMTPAELQARIGVGERGVIENASIVKSDGPDGLALRVKTGAPQENGPAVSFQWSPSGIGSASAACLSYSVLIPRDFPLSQGGYLPGIAGDMTGLPKGTTSTQTGFASRPRWGDNGTFDIETNTSQAELGEGAQRIASKTVTLPQGRWVRIDQEVVLNTPNAQDGQLRVWIDGRLAITNSKIAWRGHGGIRIVGVAADVGYAPMRANILPTRKPSEIKLSPLQMSWSAPAQTALSK